MSTTSSTKAEGVELSDVAQSVKRALTAKGRTPAEVAEKIGRETARGLGPALAKCVAAGVAVKNADGTYSKVVVVKAAKAEKLPGELTPVLGADTVVAS